MRKNFYLEMHMKKMMQQCCACGEAKYQLTFKGLWSSQTHKKDWPTTIGKRVLYE
jgi:hypothetical protein